MSLNVKNEKVHSTKFVLWVLHNAVYSEERKGFLVKNSDVCLKSMKSLEHYWFLNVKKNKANNPFKR